MAEEAEAEEEEEEEAPEWRSSRWFHDSIGSLAQEEWPEAEEEEDEEEEEEEEEDHGGATWWWCCWCSGWNVSRPVGRGVSC